MKKQKKQKAPVLIRVVPQKHHPILYRLAAVLAVVGGGVLGLSVLHGIALAPWYYMTYKPNAPISCIYTWCICHMGIIGFALVHFFAAILLICCYFDYIAMMRWKRENEAEQAAGGD